MSEHATIFIPDISGYTEFLSKTELGIKYVVAFKLSAGGGELTHLAARIGTESGQELAPEVSAMVRQSLQVAVQNFKAFCEAGGSRLQIPR